MTAADLGTHEIEAVIARVTWWRKRLAFAIGVLVAGGAVAAIIPLWVDEKWEKLASIGGYAAGTVGIVWALAAMLAVLLTFLAQQEQIAQQRIELRYQQESLEEQRKEMVAQTATFRRQQFDSTYFELLRAQGDVLARVRMERFKQDAVLGAEAMETLFNRVVGQFDTMLKQGDIPNDVSGAVTAYQVVYRQNETLLGPYYRSLYQLIKYVDDEPQSIFDRNERRRYVNFARARLASSELQLLFYNGLSPEGEGMKPLMQKYALLKHLPYNLLINAQHAAAYPISVFRRDQTEQDSPKRP